MTRNNTADVRARANNIKSNASISATVESERFLSFLCVSVYRCSKGIYM
jgi:hypothetical protein